MKEKMKIEELIKMKRTMVVENDLRRVKIGIAGTVIGEPRNAEIVVVTVVTVTEIVIGIEKIAEIGMIGAIKMKNTSVADVVVKEEIEISVMKGTVVMIVILEEVIGIAVVEIGMDVTEKRKLQEGRIAIGVVVGKRAVVLVKISNIRVVEVRSASKRRSPTSLVVVLMKEQQNQDVIHPKPDGSSQK